jgi:hypothetical protein
MVRHGNILRAGLVPSREGAGIQPGIPAVGNVNGPDWITSRGDSGGDVLVVAVDLLLLGTAAVGVEGRGFSVCTTGDVVIEDTTALRTTDCEVGYTPDDFGADCVHFCGRGEGSCQAGEHEGNGELHFELKIILRYSNVQNIRI